MPQPVKLSDSLVRDARFASGLTERSIAGQIEFWASLGRAVDGLLRGKDALALKQRGTNRPLAECVAEIGTVAGEKRVQAVLAARPFPHFEDVPGQPDLLVRIDDQGKRTVGQFVDRQFVEKVSGGI